MNDLRDSVSKCLLQEVHLSEHHIRNYDICIRKWLKDIIIENGKICIKLDQNMYILNLCNYKFFTGDITPSDAHKFNLSYTGDILVDIEGVVYSKKQTSQKSDHDVYKYFLKNIDVKNVLLCKFPIMLYSEACVFSRCDDMNFLTSPEYGGSFIVKGKRRYIPLLRSICHNYPLRLLRHNKNTFLVQIRSEHWDRKHRSTSTLELLLNEDKSTRSIIFNDVNVKIPFLIPPVPISIVILSLGWSLENFLNMVKIMNTKFYDDSVFKKYFICFKNRTYNCKTENDAIVYISNLYKNQSCLSTKNIIRNEILPHLNKEDIGETNYNKGVYLAYVFGLLILFKEKKISQTDRDSKQHCRIIDPGTSLAFLFRILFLKHMKQCVKNLKRAVGLEQFFDFEKIFNHQRLTQRIISALATGTWSQKKKGVSHPMITTNDQAIISQLRRISSSNLNNDGKHWKPRMLHPTSYGYECSAETPEGEACGLVTSLATFCRITHSSDAHILMEIVNKQMSQYVSHDIKDVSKVHYKLFDPCGRFVGWCVKHEQFCNKFKNLRRSLDIDPFCGISIDHEINEIRIQCEKGRLIRPLLVVENLHKIKDVECISITKLLSTGSLEYVSPCEELSLKVASSLKNTVGCTHVEVSDNSFVGVIASLSPFFRHNQGPRLVYWIGMCKQAICSSIKNDIGSATTHNLWYGQKPIAVTKTSKHLDMDQIPECVNTIVIFHPHPANQEDAIVMNRASVDRGMFVSDSVRTYLSENQIGFANNYKSECFEKPNQKTVLGIKIANYEKLQENGIPMTRTWLESGDVVIGKTITTKKISNLPSTNTTTLLRNIDKQNKRRDNSILLRDDESGQVQYSQILTRGKSEIAKVRVRTTRRPEVGDKFSSRHSQKGTIGRLVDPEDLPFCAATGMIPDIVMSPLGITSRMTMGKVIEIIFGKTAALSGNLLHAYDDQDFQKPIDEKIELVSDILKKAGFASSGKEVFIDGISGRMINTPIMSGIVSYSKLNHMVSRKAHARSTGSVHRLTRQPIEGRRQGGGLRFGPMEAECVIAHSASETLKERYSASTDEFQCFVCSTCGHMANGNETIGYYFCSCCKTGKNIRRVLVGHSNKLLIQELSAIGVKVQMSLKDL